MSADSDPPPPYEAQDPALSTALPSAQIVQSTFYHVYRSRSGNYRVLLDDQTPSFYINNRIWRMPDLTIHRGNGDYDRKVADCNFPEFGTHYEMNLFQEENNSSLIAQTKMTLDGRFTAIISVPDRTGVIVRMRRSFRWNQTSSPILIDQGTGQTLAIMHEVAFGLMKCFILEIKVPYGYRFELLVVISAMAIYESKRRGNPKPLRACHGPRVNK